MRVDAKWERVRAGYSEQSPSRAETDVDKRPLAVRASLTCPVERLVLVGSADDEPRRQRADPRLRRDDASAFDGLCYDRVR